MNTVSGSTVTLITSGTCTNHRNAAGNAIYLAATPVTSSFSINPAPVISGGGGGGGGGGAAPPSGSPVTVAPTEVTIEAACRRRPARRP